MLMSPIMVAAETGAVEYDQMPRERVVIAAHRTGESRTFELPMSVWYTMFISYAVFFGALLAVTGSDRGALFMIVISMGYTVMYFGTAAALNMVGQQAPVAANHDDIDTYTGLLGYNAAIAQILTVPVLVAFFGCVVAAIYAAVTP